jgi:hypothetical protein
MSWAKGLTNDCHNAARYCQLEAFLYQQYMLEKLLSNVLAEGQAAIAEQQL